MSASPLRPHTATPAELRERIAAERRGLPFLVLREGVEGPQRLVDLDDLGARLSIGRGPQNEVSVPWDAEVSRLHAALECIAGEWTVADDGLSRNGTYLNGVRVAGRQRLRDGDQLRVGRTVIAYRRPDVEDSMPTQVGVAQVALTDLPPMQRAVLVALARPPRGALYFVK